MNELQQQIEALEKRLEQLEGKERAAVYDPATNTVAESLVEAAKIAEPPAGNQASREAHLGLEPGVFDAVEEFLKRPGGLLEQFKTAQRETEERQSAIDIQLLAITNDLASRASVGDLQALQNALSNRSG